MQHSDEKKIKILLQAIADVIKEERIDNNKSQRLLSYEFEIQRSLISRIENLKNVPKLTSLWSLSEALGIKFSLLISKIEKKLPEDFSILND